MCLCDRFIASFQRARIQQGAQNRGPQQSLAHWRLARIERMKQRCAAVLTHEQRLNEFKVAHRHLV